MENQQKPDLININLKILIEKATLISVMLIGLAFFNSCISNDNEAEILVDENVYPDQILKDVEILYSTKGEVQFKLKAPILKQYSGKEAYNEMPEGVDIEIFDSTLKVTTKLTSNYAIDISYADKMEAKYDVIVVNDKGEQLNTEHLVWNKKTSKITSDVFVKITTETQVLMGDGLIANQDFTNYRILKPRGIINIENDKSD